ncbi:BTAD domain-containing putative transcriptional regulator [Kitasatospora sp. NPDC087314]|uniref:AfsR/SARP family transcriptional regulator n=1 Tax=Kitasatospora sp. NPDC087314 TaxID=3364068 RepID=UPI003810B0D5
MDIGILGPLTVTHAGRSLVPTAAKPRQVLALLALHQDQAVSVAALTEELWEHRPPRSVHTTLQTYVFQLRNLIEEALAASGRADTSPKELLATWGGGYLLATEGGESDLRDFEQIAAAGHRLMTAGDLAAASGCYRDALTFWRGDPLADVQTGPLLEAEARRLEQTRLEVLGRRIEADLRLGRHHDVLAELAGLCVQYPLHEGFQGQHMLALCRTGRRAEALGAFQRVRARIRTELGLEPSPSLWRVQRSILVDEGAEPEDGPCASNPLAAVLHIAR